jgi:hypothetical protein
VALAQRDANFHSTPPRGIVSIMPDTPPTPLALFLAEHDVPCPNPKCGFNLRGLKDATCPECREPLSLTVRRPEALWYMRKWVVAALICLALSSIAGCASWIVSLITYPSIGWLGWDSMISLATTCACAIAWPIVLGMLIHANRKKNPRAIPRALLSLLIGICVTHATYSLLSGWHVIRNLLYGPW